MKMPSNSLKRRPMNRIQFSYHFYKIQVSGKGQCRIPMLLLNKKVLRHIALFSNTGVFRLVQGMSPLAPVPDVSSRFALEYRSQGFAQNSRIDDSSYCGKRTSLNKTSGQNKCA